MPGDRKTRRIYRDTVTGQFVSKKKYNRSRAHGGTRYKRQSIKIGVKSSAPVAPTHPPLLPPPRVQTFFATFRYTNARGTRQFDFFVRASSAEEVQGFVNAFVKGHPKFETPVDNIFTRLGTTFGWTEPPKIVAVMTPDEFPEFESHPKGYVEIQ